MIALPQQWTTTAIGPVLCVVAGVFVMYMACITLKHLQRRRRWAAIGKDVVVLHVFPRGKLVPNMSNFGMKLETYLRMAQIPYECDFDEPFGPRHKTPWISLNGEEFGDSELIMEILNRKFNKDFNRHLKPEDQAISRAFQIMTEDHLYWVGALHRWVYNKGKEVPTIVNLSLGFRLAIPFIAHKFKTASYYQGIGRHTRADATEMGFKDLRAVSVFLGDKAFFMGDKPTEVDCTLFGLLAQFLWNEREGSPFLRLIESELNNLKDYCFRMKETFWPDWDYCLNPPSPSITK